MDVTIGILAAVLGAAPAPAQGSVLAIRADKVVVADGKTIENATILVEDGKIAEVGADVDVPEGASFLRHAGFASAGLVALHSYSGTPSELYDSTRPVLADARVARAFDPQNGDFPEALRVGITSVVVAPVPAALCAGTSAVVKTAGGVVVRDQAQLSLGFSARSLRNNRFPTSHAGAVAEADRLFEDAEGVFARAAEGDLPVLLETATREDVLRAIDFARRHELSGAVSGAEWAGELAQRLREAELAVVCAPVRFGEERRALRAVLALEKEGVPFGFAIDAPVNHPAVLRTGAAMCLREGLGRAAAWRALTSDAARIAGAQDRIGALEEGLDADVVLWSGDPLDLASSVRAVYVDGRLAWRNEP